MEVSIDDLVDYESDEGSADPVRYVVSHCCVARITKISSDPSSSCSITTAYIP